MQGSSDQSTEWWEEQTRTLHGGHTPRAAVFVRSLAPPVGACQQQEAVLDRLQTFERQGLFEAVDISVWGKSIRPESAAARTAPGRQLLEYVDEFRSWGARTDEEIELPFEETTVSCSFTDEHYEKLVLPRLCLAMYSGDQLELVLPCEVDGECYGVADLLSAMTQHTTVEQELGTSA